MVHFVNYSFGIWSFGKLHFVKLAFVSFCKIDLSETTSFHIAEKIVSHDKIV